MEKLRISIFMIAILGAGALFGFYFTMSVSIMPGFDMSPPYAALIANQEIGRATQQSLFFVALLGTPIALLALLSLSFKQAAVRRYLIVALLGWALMMIVTFYGNVPLNQILDALTISSDMDGAEAAWQAYSVPWQNWNWLRVLFSGFSLLSTAFAAAFWWKQA